MGILSSLLGQRADKSPSSDYWYSPIGSVSKAGMYVDENQVLRISAVLQGVRFLSQTVAGLPRHVFQSLDDGRSRQKLPSHQLSKFLRYQPNPWQTAFQFYEMFVARAMLRGFSLAERVYDDNTGDLLALVPLDSGRVAKIEQLSTGKLRYLYRKNDGSVRTLLQDQVFSLSGFGVDGIRGLSLVQQMQETAGLALAMETYGARFFSNSAMPRVVLRHPKHLTQPSRDRLRDDWNTAYGGVEQSNKAAVLEDGMEVEVLSTHNDEAQFLESRKFLIAEFSRHIDVTPHRLSDMEKSSFNNVEQMSLETVVYSIAPWVNRLEQSIHRDLLTQEDKDSGHYVKFIMDGLLRGDTQARQAFYQSGIQSGWLTRNEVREHEDKNPIDGLDTPLQPQNMAPVGDDGQPILPENSEPVPPIPEERARALAITAAERVLRREKMAVAKWNERKNGDNPGWRIQVETFYKEHVDFVCKTLAIDKARAVSWCSSRCRAVLELGEDSLEAWARRDEQAVDFLAREALR